MDNRQDGGPEGPAAKAIRLLGAKAIAHRCDLTTDAVWKWPKRHNGHIPPAHQSNVLKLARDLKVDLSAEDILGIAA